MSDDDHFETNEQQLQTFINACGGDDSTALMVDEVANCLEVSRLTSIDIKGSEHFRFTDSLVQTLTEAIISSKISLKYLTLRNHRITDEGVIQLCQLILV